MSGVSFIVLIVEMGQAMRMAVTICHTMTSIMTALAFPSALTTRLNARLDPTTAERLQYLMTRTGLAMSEVVRMSLDHFYNATRKDVVASKDGLDALIGKHGSGAKIKGQLSSDYKALYRDGLAKKHGKALQK